MSNTPAVRKVEGVIESVFVLCEIKVGGSHMLNAVRTVLLRIVLTTVRILQTLLNRLLRLPSREALSNRWNKKFTHLAFVAPRATSTTRNVSVNDLNRRPEVNKSLT